MKQHSKTDFKMTFNFELKNGQSCDPKEWLQRWEQEYPSDDYGEKYYDHLIRRTGSLSSEDFILMGRWKDNARTDGKWRPNVAMVAFPAWVDASVELSGFSIEQSSLEAFLKKWSDHLYPDTSARSADGKKRFGLSRTTTLLHFISAGRFPICDSRVRSAIKHLCNIRTPDEVEQYLNSYVSIFEQLARVCDASARSLDKALFAYGAAKSK
jgi:hypothetical protein